MEIYRSSADNRLVTLEVPFSPVTGTLEVTVYNQDVLVLTVATVTYDAGVLSFTLPFSLVQSDKEYTVHWKFNYVESATTYEYDNYTTVNVVTPILPIADIRTIVGTDFTDAEVATLEKAVRYIIQAHTGQFFGKFIGYKMVTGSGEPNLRLPARLITLTSVNDNIYWNQTLALRGGGWFLRNRAIGIPSIRADYDGWHQNPWTSEAPIGLTQYRFIENVEYKIDGIWGWTTVPAAVQEAAKLLINDYACADSNYRDRFLTSMTAADWRIQFHEGAFSNTGNVRANQLLAEFVLRRGWVVL